MGVLQIINSTTIQDDIGGGAGSGVGAGPGGGPRAAAAPPPLALLVVADGGSHQVRRLPLEIYPVEFYPEKLLNSINVGTNSQEYPERLYREVQLDFTPEMEVFCIMLDRSLPIFTMASVKQHKEYFNFRNKIQLDQPVFSCEWEIMFTQQGGTAADAGSEAEHHLLQGRQRRRDRDRRGGLRSGGNGIQFGDQV